VYVTQVFDGVFGGVEGACFRCLRVYLVGLKVLASAVTTQDLLPPKGAVQAGHKAKMLAVYGAPKRPTAPQRREDA
jgi:hypothetical protein